MREEVEGAQHLPGTTDYGDARARMVLDGWASQPDRLLEACGQGAVDVVAVVVANHGGIAGVDPEAGQHMDEGVRVRLVDADLLGYDDQVNERSQAVFVDLAPCGSMVPLVSMAVRRPASRTSRSSLRAPVRNSESNATARHAVSAATASAWLRPSASQRP